MTENSTSSLLPLKDLHLPDAPSWLPLAWGWWAAVGATIAVLLLIWLTLRWKKKRMAPKKTALRLLQHSDQPSAAIELLRQAAFCYFPREEIAQLTGPEWYVFLDSHVQKPLFVPNQTAWQQALYSKEPIQNSQQLVQHCAQWVEEALPPKRRRR
ncbi:DUF4381 domain-containing protein [Vibrio sp. TRT 21S02]|uniref:DUF4381 domain-containing protein n=1 Tax=Vibrio sp. TRT 21S02 TaxID=3418507 RepID=UPI003CF3AC03